MPFSIAKRHKRIVILNESDDIVYALPVFVVLNSRYDIQFVVDKFNETGQYDINAIMELESKFHPNRRMRT